MRTAAAGQVTSGPRFYSGHSALHVCVQKHGPTRELELTPDLTVRLSVSARARARPRERAVRHDSIVRSCGVHPCTETLTLMCARIRAHADALAHTLTLSRTNQIGSDTDT